MKNNYENKANICEKVNSVSKGAMIGFGVAAITCGILSIFALTPIAVAVGLLFGTGVCYGSSVVSEYLATKYNAKLAEVPTDEKLSNVEKDSFENNENKTNVSKKKFTKQESKNNDSTMEM